MVTQVFRETLDSGKFVVTANLDPPKGADPAGLLAKVESLKGKVDAVNISDNSHAVMRMCPLAACKLVQDKGVEIILNMACRDRNRLALQSDLLGAFALGLHNVLCITGNHVTLGDHKDAKPVFDLDSVQLLQVVGILSRGKDLSGHELTGIPDFLLGAAVNPSASPLDPQLIKFEKKVQAGAQFFQTQAAFDLERFTNFMKHARNFPVKVLAGVWVLTADDIASYEAHRLPGFYIPNDIVTRVKEAKDSLEQGISIAAELVKEIKDSKIADGVHLMAMGKEDVIPEVLKAAGL